MNWLETVGFIHITFYSCYGLYNVIKLARKGIKLQEPDFFHEVDFTKIENDMINRCNTK